jgi:hypothetical protein
MLTHDDRQRLLVMKLIVAGSILMPLLGLAFALLMELYS